MTRIDIVQRGTPTDPRLASGRALQQPRVVSAHTRGSPQSGPRSEVRHARGNRRNLLLKLKVATWNVGTMRGKGSEIVETLSRRHIDICCVQETRWRGGSARTIVGKDSRYKLFWQGNENGFGGVGILIAEKWITSVLSVDRVNPRIINIRLLIGKMIVNIYSAYAPQSGLSLEEKESFYCTLQDHALKVPDNEFLLIGGDFNGHVGSTTQGFENVHGNHGYGVRNPDGIRQPRLLCII